MPITDYSTSAASNTTLGIIPIGPGMERNKVNDAIQQLMADIAELKPHTRTIVFVEKYGAVGDGVADDGPAVIAAQAAVQAQGGGTVCFNAGKTYNIVTPITMARGVTYEGSGRSGINQVNTQPGAVLKAGGTSIFKNAATTIDEVKFSNLFFRSTSGGGHIWDWSSAGAVAKIEIVGCTIVQENTDKYIIRGTAAGGVFSIYIHDCEWQYATGNTVSPLHFAAPTVNSLVIESFWSTCTTQATSGTYAIYVESTNAGGAGFNIAIRDGVFELPGGGSIRMRSCTESIIENCMVYDLTVTPNNIQFLIDDGAGPPSNNCVLKNINSRVGTTTVPDCKIDCSVAGQSAFTVDSCSFLWLDGGAATPSITLIGGNITNVQNLAYLGFRGSPTLDIEFKTTDGSGKTYTIWNGYSGLGNGYLNFGQNGSYIGSFSPTGLFQWGGTRAAPAYYISQGGQLNTKGAIYPATPALADQLSAAIFAGSGAPNNANGNNGDFYLRSDGGASTTIYHKRAGAWVGVV